LKRGSEIGLMEFRNWRNRISERLGEDIERRQGEANFMSDLFKYFERVLQDSFSSL